MSIFVQMLKPVNRFEVRTFQYIVIIVIFYFTDDHVCLNTQFSCDNGRCVPSSYVCDYENDCGDNSDETQDCGKS